MVVTADGSAKEISLRAGGNGVFRADIYSQNEIERIADQALSQLSLIDNFEAGQIAHITAELRTLTSHLATNATTLMPLQDQIDSLNSEIAGLPGVEDKIKALGPITGQNAEAVTKAQQAKSLRQRETQALTGVKQMMLDGGAEIDDLLRQARSRLSKMQSELGDAGTSLGGSRAQQEIPCASSSRNTKLRAGQAAERGEARMTPQRPVGQEAPARMSQSIVVSLVLRSLHAVVCSLGTL